MKAMKCEVCSAEVAEEQLHRCPICSKLFCDECSVDKGDKKFCSRFCAEFSFYGGPEPED